MKAQFIVKIEGDWRENSKPVTKAMVEKRLRDVAKEGFSFLADRVTVQRHSLTAMDAATAQPAEPVTWERVKAYATDWLYPADKEGEFCGGEQALMRFVQAMSGEIDGIPAPFISRQLATPAQSAAPMTDSRIKEISEATFAQVDAMPDPLVNGDTWDRCFARNIELETQQSIINKCAKVCDERAEEHKYGAFWDSRKGEEAQACADSIRRLLGSAKTEGGK